MGRRWTASLKWALTEPRVSARSPWWTDDRISAEHSSLRALSISSTNTVSSSFELEMESSSPSFLPQMSQWNNKAAAAANKYTLRQMLSSQDAEDRLLKWVSECSLSVLLLLLMLMVVCNLYQKKKKGTSRWHCTDWKKSGGGRHRLEKKKKLLMFGSQTTATTAAATAVICCWWTRRLADSKKWRIHRERTFSTVRYRHWRRRTTQKCDKKRNHNGYGVGSVFVLGRRPSVPMRRTTASGSIPVPPTAASVVTQTLLSNGQWPLHFSSHISSYFLLSFSVWLMARRSPSLQLEGHNLVLCQHTTTVLFSSGILFGGSFCKKEEPTAEFHFLFLALLLDSADISIFSDLTTTSSVHSSSLYTTLHMA